MGDESDRRQAILDAAFEEFSTKGFQGATIKSIARAAGVRSPALLYWYFPTKEDLFQAVLGQHAPILQVVLDPGSLRDRPPEEVLPLLARAYLATADTVANQRLLRLLVSEALRRPEIADMLGKRLIDRVLGFLKGYLAHQIALGRLRPHDVRASARAFIGTLLPQIVGKVAIPALAADGLTDEEHIATVVAIFLAGLRPGAAGGDTTGD